MILSIKNSAIISVFLGNSFDPVNVFELYKKKRNPANNFMWQRPKRLVHYTDEIWYERMRVGHDPLERFMRFLSENAKLSKIYTNHSIRATVITNLSNSGYEARHIIAVTGHKSESTVKQYATKCPDAKKEKCHTL